MQLLGRPYTIAGTNFYPALAQAASLGASRDNVTAVFQAMQSLGMNVMRTWAFNDGPPGSFQAVQTSPGQLEEPILRLSTVNLNSNPKTNLKTSNPYLDTMYPMQKSRRALPCWMTACQVH